MIESRISPDCSLGICNYMIMVASGRIDHLFEVLCKTATKLSNSFKIVFEFSQNLAKRQKQIKAFPGKKKTNRVPKKSRLFDQNPALNPFRVISHHLIIITEFKTIFSSNNASGGKYGKEIYRH